MRKHTLLIILTLCLQVYAQNPLNMKGVWGDIDSDIAPWVENVSRPNKIEQGLADRHISLWASHGRFYDLNRAEWRWQRPFLFGTTEDLFTQTIVIPYLIPMLENAGCYVFTPRERDWQKREYIVDNDTPNQGGHYEEFCSRNAFDQSPLPGFAYHSGYYSDGENPFCAGTAKTMRASKQKDGDAISFSPAIEAEGRYAVYVSYPKLDDAVDDAHYTVYHKGKATEFRVNQQIGYGTWVYLGTFDFGVGPNLDNRVVLTSTSRRKGHIGIDAVRFGGGMGNILREGSASGYPRCLEAGRYYGQWAGAPYSIYSAKDGADDYGDDINERPLMTNWVAGGSCFAPTVEGLGVPLELSLAIHSDAGYNEDGTSVHGSLAIATTNHNDGILSSGITRQTSFDLASQLLNGITYDMSQTFGTWNKRYLWDRNYGETRMPEVPSAIIETLSHQSFPDMKIAQHPYGKFMIARSIYKTLLRYICEQHGRKYIVEPLAPTDFRIEIVGSDKIQIQWTGVADVLEPSAGPTSYNLYTAIGDQDFDNGQNVKANGVTVKLQPGLQYNFRVTACNNGGESFPTETLSAYIAPNSSAKVLVVNGFERLSAPYIIDNATEQGFDLDRDEGVQRGIYPGWSGRQICFNKKTMGKETTDGLGYSGNELAGLFIAGNEFNYAVDHTSSIASSTRYSVSTCSLKALEKGLVDLTKYDVVDFAFGLQKDDGQLGIHYKTFSAPTMSQVQNYLNHGGRLFVNGAYICSDMCSADESIFLKNCLHVVPVGNQNITSGDIVNGLGMQFNIYRNLNEQHYAVTHPDIIVPSLESICAMQYSDGNSAAVGYKGPFSTFVMGFPFECIINKDEKNKIMQGILAYLLQ